ncbi:MAG: transglycosylase domain-containing protein [Candidatus Saccharibacteria bacterium]|nr:transglycosylase domain-containing protein [Candidatus Saccharibacteria bacterium]
MAKKKSSARKRTTTKAKKASKQGRKSKSTFTTKSGQTIKLHRNVMDKVHARRDANARKKALRLAGMPKSRVKRFFYRLHPKRMYRYWFSREGAMMALKLGGIAIVVGFLFLVGLFAYFRKDLPNLRDISGNNIGGSIQYYDRTGEILLWEDYDAVKRTPVEDEQIDQDIKDATIALEDQDFFNHGGFDVGGITRAAYSNLAGGRTTQGGSTITQQLVKLTQNWTEERTYTRKVKELILSVELERSYSKQEILTGYLNTAPYGDITYGVEAATQDYFGKSAEDVTHDEAAFLAAMPKSPTIYSPYGARYDKEELVGRQHYTLDLMAQQGYITEEERDKAKEVETLDKLVKRQPKYHGIKAPYFVLTAKEQLQEKFIDTAQVGGWKVRTTLNMDLQKEAEKQVQEGLPQVRAQGGDSIAFAAEDVRNGQMVALVGGTDFSNDTYGQNNYAREKLPPGSSIKPYDYVSLIDNTDQFGAGSVLYDKVTPLEGYPCTTGARRGGNCLTNYDFREPGPLTLRYALGGSRNIPAVKAMLIAGIDTTIETAEKLMADPGAPEEVYKNGYNCYHDDQLTDVAPCYASSAIGDGAYLKLDRHVHGLASISRNGKTLPQSYLLKVTDASNNTIYEWEQEEGEQVVRPEAAYIVADILSDPRASYLSRKSHDFQGHNFSLKTGTTNDSKDGWMMGFSTYYAAGTWVGYHNREVELSGFMENMTQPILTGWMNAVHTNLEPKERPRPEGIQELPAYIVRNHVGVGSIEPSPSTDLYPSWYAKNPGTRKEVTIDKVSKKLATDCTPPLARERVSGGGASSFSSDPFVDGGAGGANTEEEDDVHDCGDSKPGVSLSANKTGGNSWQISTTVSQGTHPLSSSEFPGKIDYKINGKTVRSVSVSSGGTQSSFTYTPNFTGTKQMTAEIVDSVLYQSSDTAAITAKKKVESINITAPSGDANGNVTVLWSGGSGPFDVTVDGGTPVSGCSGTNSRDCEVVIPPDSGEYVIRVEDEDSSDSVTINSDT